MMNQQKVRFSSDCQLDCGQAGIDRRRNPTDDPRVFDLKAIHGTSVIFKFRRAQNAVAVSDDGIQRGLRHIVMKPKKTRS
jgi:hypothetical protein